MIGKLFTEAGRIPLNMEILTSLDLSLTYIGWILLQSKLAIVP
jgi:hypothetical protein